MDEYDENQRIHHKNITDIMKSIIGTDALLTLISIKSDFILILTLQKLVSAEFAISFFPVFPEDYVPRKPMPYTQTRNIVINSNSEKEARDAIIQYHHKLILQSCIKLRSRVLEQRTVKWLRR